MGKSRLQLLKEADGGFASRKLWYAVATSFMIVGLGCLAAFWPSFRPSLETVVGGVVGTLALYLGANVTGRLATGKAFSYTPIQEASEPTPKPPVEPP